MLIKGACILDILDWLCDNGTLLCLFIAISLRVVRERLAIVDASRSLHYDDVIMSAMASQITSLTIVYSSVYLGEDQRKHQSSASLAFVWGIHRWPVNSPQKWPVTRTMFPFDDVIMCRVMNMNVFAVNSMAPGGCGLDFKCVIFKRVVENTFISIFSATSFRWMQKKSALVQWIAWCRQATNQNLNQCWPRSTLPNDVTRPQWDVINVPSQNM